MKNITIILMMLIASISFGQNAPIDFEDGGIGASWTWTVFENSTNPAVEIINNPDATGGNTSAKVAKFTALAAGNPWAGTESAHGDTDLGTFLLDETNSTIKIMVWKPRISDVGMKLATASGWAQPELKVANTVVNAWEEITFDFSGVINNPDGELYDQIIIFPDYEARTEEIIVYFDNITFGPAETGPTDGPTTAAPMPPARDAANVISVFSGAYADLAGTNFNPAWSQSTVVTTVDIEGNPTLKYANFNYQGTEFATPINATEMDTLHVDMWTADATNVNIFAISTGPVEVAFNLPVTPNQWVSYDIPMSAFNPVNLADVIQFKFDGGDGTPTIYLDNIYFYKEGDTPPVGEAPRNPIDFEAGGFGADWTWTVFENGDNPAVEIIDNPDASGGNTSAKVAKFTALAAGNPWAGVESAHGNTDLGTFLLDETNSTIKIMVWKPRISDVGMKLATATGWAQPEVKVANTVVNAWEEITFDFSEVPNNPDGELYDQIIIFPDYEARTDEIIVYFDNITFGPAGGGEEGDDATLSDLQVDGATVAGFSAAILNYAVTLPEGTTDVPTVTATTNDPEANAVITPATEIPGTTSIVVTSANTNVELTYTVAFSVQSGGEEGPRNPIDFEVGGYGADWTWAVFENGTNPALEIIDNPDATGGNTSAKVAKFTALATGNPWAGTESAHGDTDLGSFIIDETNSTIKIMVWKPVISDVGIKLATATGWAQPEVKVANTVINAWEEITFDFSEVPNNPDGEMYDQIIIFPDYNLDGRGQDNIVYFDNITFNPAGGTSVETEQINSLRLYPNPVRPGVNVKMSAEVSHFEVFDFAGRKIMSLNGSVIPTQGVDQGVYLVRIHTLNGEVQTQKLIIK